MPANIVAVDFYRQGDALRAVNEINRVESSTSVSSAYHGIAAPGEEDRGHDDLVSATARRMPRTLEPSV